MIEHFYLFSELNRDGKEWTLEEAFDWKPCKIISMGDDEDAYLFSMQLMLGEATIVPFQKFHDDYWIVDDRNMRGYRYETLRDFLEGVIFCTDPRFLDYMMDHAGDLKWQKNQREKKHWSQPVAQHSMLKDWLI